MWYYAIEQKKFGPASETGMRRLISKGRINGETLVWREGMAEWMTLRRSDLAVHLPIAPVVPTPPPLPTRTPVPPAIPTISPDNRKDIQSALDIDRSVRVRIPVPAPRVQREQIAKMLLAMQYVCDVNCRNFFDTHGLSVEDFELEEILELEVGLVLKLMEQHIQHARDYATSKSSIGVVEYIESHITILNHVHSSAYAAVGHFFPVNDSLKNISDYIVHFLHFRPDRCSVTIPEIMIPEMTKLIAEFYCGNIQL